MRTYLLAIMAALAALTTAAQSIDGRDIKYTGDVSLVGTVAYGSATEMTITDGQITPTVPYISANPQTLTSDEITQVNGLSIGQVVYLVAADPANDVLVLKHGAGNLSLPTATDITLTHGGVMLMGAPNSDVLVVGGGGSSTTGTVDAADVTVAATPSNYTAATPDVEAHLAGIDTALASVGGDSLVWTSTVNSYYLVDATLGSGATNVTTSGWTMEAGARYRLELDVVWGSASAGDLHLYLNGDTTDSNYRLAWQYTNAGGAAITAGSYNGPRISYTISSGSGSSVPYIVDIWIDAAGYARMYAVQAGEGASTQKTVLGSICKTNATVTSITSLTINSSVASAIDTGTRYRIYRMRDVQGGSYAPRWDNATLDQYNGSLAGYWPFSETSGTRYDLMRSTALADGNTVGWTSGVAGTGGAAQFVVASSEYLLGTSPKRTPSNILFSAWIRLDSLGATRGIAGMRNRDANTANLGWAFLVNNTNVLYAGIANNGGTDYDDVTGTTALTTATWYHVACWVDSGEKIHIYLNGTEEGTATTLTAPIDDVSQFTVGAYHDTGSLTAYYNGAIATPALWIDLPAQDLTAVETIITALYNSGTPVRME